MSSDHTPFLLIISAPSGCGKTTLLKELFIRVSGLGISISHTTREPRANEISGVDYHFVERALFSQMQKADKFVESAFVHDNHYGTARSSITQLLDDGLDVVLDIDVQGMKEVKASSLFNAVTVFILPPGIDELEIRLRNRKSDSDVVIKQRLENAVGEIAQAHLYDYLVLNGLIDEAADLLAAIVQAERIRTSRSFLLNHNP
ncbi:guanylate kinase [bacterium]|nr:guanylate kinase [bacterium]